MALTVNPISAQEPQGAATPTPQKAPASVPWVPYQPGTNASGSATPANLNGDLGDRIVLPAIPAKAVQEAPSPKQRTQIAVTGKNLTGVLDVEIARTPEEIETGLKNRTEMPGNQGMLFVYANEQVHEFWMKDTLIALDMIFLDKDHKIVSIVENAAPQTEDRRASGKPAQYVVEVVGGFSKQVGLAVGDTLDFQVPEALPTPEPPTPEPQIAREPVTPQPKPLDPALAPVEARAVPTALPTPEPLRSYCYFTDLGRVRESQQEALSGWLSSSKYTLAQTRPAPVAKIVMKNPDRKDLAGMTEPYLHGSVTQFLFPIINLLSSLPYVTELALYTVAGIPLIINQSGIPLIANQSGNSKEISITIYQSGDDAVNAINSYENLFCSWNDKKSIDLEAFKSGNKLDPEKIEQAIKDLRELQGRVVEKAGTKKNTDGSSQPGGEYNEQVAQVFNHIRRTLENLLYEAKQGKKGCFSEERVWQASAGEAVPEGIPLGLTHMQVRLRILDGNKIRLESQDDFGPMVGYQLDLESPLIDSRMARECLDLLNRFEAAPVSTDEKGNKIEVKGLQEKIKEIREKLEGEKGYTFTSDIYLRIGDRFHPKASIVFTYSNDSYSLRGGGTKFQIYTNGEKKFEIDLSDPKLDADDLDEALEKIETWREAVLRNPDEKEESRKIYDFTNQEQAVYQRLKNAIEEKRKNPAFVPVGLFQDDQRGVLQGASLKEVMNPGLASRSPFIVATVDQDLIHSYDLRCSFQGNVFVIKIGGEDRVVINLADPYLSAEEIREAREKLTEILVTVQNGSDSESIRAMIRELNTWEKTGARLIYYDVPFVQAPGASQLLDMGRVGQLNQLPSAYLTYQQEMAGMGGGRFASWAAFDQDAAAFLALTDGAVRGNRDGMIGVNELTPGMLLELFRLFHRQSGDASYGMIYGAMTRDARRVFDFINRNNNVGGQELQTLEDWGALQITPRTETKRFSFEYACLSKSLGRDFTAVVEPFLSNEERSLFWAGLRESPNRTTPVAGKSAPIAVPASVQTQVAQMLQQKDMQVTAQQAAASVKPSDETQLFLNPFTRISENQDSPSFVFDTFKYYESLDFDPFKNTDSSQGKHPYLSLVNGRELRLDLWGHVWFPLFPNKRKEAVLDLESPFPREAQERKLADQAVEIYQDWIEAMKDKPGAKGLPPPLSPQGRELVQKISNALIQYANSGPKDFKNDEALGQFVVQSKKSGMKLYIKCDQQGMVEAIRGFEDQECHEPSFSIYFKGRSISPEDRIRAAQYLADLREEGGVESTGRDAACLQAVERALKLTTSWQSIEDVGAKRTLRCRTVQDGNEAVRLELSHSVKDNKTLTHVRLIQWGVDQVCFEGDQLLDLSFTLGDRAVNAQGEGLSRKQIKLAREMLQKWRDTLGIEIDKKYPKALREKDGAVKEAAEAELAQRDRVYQEIQDKLNQVWGEGKGLEESNFLYDVVGNAKILHQEAGSTTNSASAARLALIEARLLLTYGAKENRPAWVAQGVLACEMARGKFDQMISQNKGILPEEIRSDYLKTLFYQGVFYGLRNENQDVENAGACFSVLESLDRSGTYTQAANNAAAQGQLSTLVVANLRTAIHASSERLDPKDIIPLYLQCLSMKGTREVCNLASDIILNDFTPKKEMVTDLHSKGMRASVGITETPLDEREKPNRILSTSSYGLDRTNFDYLINDFIKPENAGLQILLELQQWNRDNQTAMSAGLKPAYDQFLLRVVADLNNKIEGFPSNVIPNGLINELTQERLAQRTGATPQSLAEEAAAILPWFKRSFGTVFERDHYHQCIKLQEDLDRHYLHVEERAGYPDRSNTQLLRKCLERGGVPLARLDQGHQIYQDKAWVHRNDDDPFGEGNLSDEEIWEFCANNYSKEINHIVRQALVDSPFYNDDETLMEQVLDLSRTLNIDPRDADGKEKQDTLADMLAKAGKIYQTVCGGTTDERALFKAFQIFNLLQRTGKTLGSPQFYLRYDAGIGAPKLALGLWEGPPDKQTFHPLSPLPQGSQTRWLSPREAMSQFFTGRGEHALLRGVQVGHESAYQAARRQYSLALEIDPRNEDALRGYTRSFLEEGSERARMDALDKLNAHLNRARDQRFEIGASFEAQVHVMLATVYYEQYKAGAQEMDGRKCLNELSQAYRLNSDLGRDPSFVAFWQKVNDSVDKKVVPQENTPSLTALRRELVQQQKSAGIDASYTDFIDLVQKTYGEAFRRLNSDRQGLVEYSLGAHQWRVAREHLATFMKNYRERSFGSEEGGAFPQEFKLTPQALLGLSGQEKAAIYDYFRVIGWNPQFCVRALDAIGHSSAIADRDGDAHLSIRILPPGVSSEEGIFLEDLFETSWSDRQRHATSQKTVVDWKSGDDLGNGLSFALSEKQVRGDWKKALRLDGRDGKIENFTALDRAIEAANRILEDLPEEKEAERLQALQVMVSELQSRGLLQEVTFTSLNAVDFCNQLVSELGKVREDLYKGLQGYEWINGRMVPVGLLGNWDEAERKIAGAGNTKDLETKASTYREALYRLAVAWNFYEDKGSLRPDASNLEDVLDAANAEANQVRGYGTLAGPLATDLAVCAKNLAQVEADLAAAYLRKGDLAKAQEINKRSMKHYEQALKFYGNALLCILPVATNPGETKVLANRILFELGTIMGAFVSGQISFDENMEAQCTRLERILIAPSDSPNFLRDLASFKSRAQIISIGRNTGLSSLAYLCFDGAAYLDPNDPQSQIARAFVLGKLGDQEQTRVELRRLQSSEGIFSDANRASLALQLGNLEFETGNNQAAKKNYFKTFTREASEQDRQMALERLLAVARKEAETDPTKYLQIFNDLQQVSEDLFTPQMSRTRELYRGIHHYMAGKYSEADQIFSSILLEQSLGYLILLKSWFPTKPDSMSQEAWSNFQTVMQKSEAALRQMAGDPRRIVTDLSVLHDLIQDLVLQVPTASTKEFMAVTEEALFYAGKTNYSLNNSKRAADLFFFSLKLKNPSASRAFFDPSINKPTEWIEEQFDLSHDILAEDDPYRSFLERAVAMTSALAMDPLKKPEAIRICQILLPLHNFEQIDLASRYVDLVCDASGSDKSAKVLEDASALLKAKIVQVKSRVTQSSEYLSKLYSLLVRILLKQGKTAEAEKALDQARSLAPQVLNQTVVAAVESYVNFTLYSYLFRVVHLEKTGGIWESLKEWIFSGSYPVVADFVKGGNDYKSSFKKAIADLAKVRESGVGAGASEAYLKQMVTIMNSLQFIMAGDITNESLATNSVDPYSAEAEALRLIGLNPDFPRSLFNDDVYGLIRASQGDTNFFNKVAIYTLWNYGRMIEAIGTGADEQIVTAYRKEINLLRDYLRKNGDTLVEPAMAMIDEGLAYLGTENIQRTYQEIDANILRSYDLDKERKEE